MTQFLTYFNCLLQVLMITAGTFMVERYVLLEPTMEAKKQRLFYIICFAAVLAAFAVTTILDAVLKPGIDLPGFAQYLALLFGAINILLGRKKRRIVGALMVLPLIGIINGVAAPIFIMQFLLQSLCHLEVDSLAVQLCTLAVYLVFAALLIVFYYKGKDWRKWFNNNMKDRSPSVTERVIIFVAGLIMAVFSAYVGYVLLGVEQFEPQFEKTLAIVAILFECIAFVATITIIVLIMQGNKRKFYHDRVSGMQFSVIATMADIVEDRDSNTGGHIKRTAKYVEIIGKYLLKKNEFPDILTKQYLEDMVVAAPLHDIGKISIPDAILNKPGRLTPEEFEIMKTHASAGREVLVKAENQMGKFDYLEIAKDMAEYHHEWFNGKGYPTGISGNDIPLCARIMAVADVFDALTSKRCYKDAMPLDKAYSIISEESGTHFDPVIADAFLNCKQDIEETMNMFTED